MSPFAIDAIDAIDGLCDKCEVQDAGWKCDAAYLVVTIRLGRRLMVPISRAARAWWDISIELLGRTTKTELACGSSKYREESSET